MNDTEPIDPCLLAFDIDGVVADTMAVFVTLAHEKYGLTHLSQQDMLSYNLYECLGLEKHIIDDLIRLTLDDRHTMQIPPVPGAPEVLMELAGVAPLLFITARVCSEPITQWLFTVLPRVPREKITVIASGAPETKIEILSGLDIRYFVDDRIETCRRLKEAGIEPFLFDQPWNRNDPADGFIRVQNWIQLKTWVLPSGTNLE
ncbi:MAG: 5' nucleotidase, NT5C type [Syntrophobacteraceae bacterium]